MWQPRHHRDAKMYGDERPRQVRRKSRSRGSGPGRGQRRHDRGRAFDRRPRELGHELVHDGRLTPLVEKAEVREQRQRHVLLPRRRRRDGGARGAAQLGLTRRAGDAVGARVAGAAARGVPVGVSRANESVDRSVTAPAKSASASATRGEKSMPKSSSPPRASPPRVAASASASNDARISDVAASRPCSPSPPARSTSRSSVTCADDVPRKAATTPPPRMRATSRAVSDWRAHQRRRAAHVDVVEPQRERGRAERRGGARRGSARVRPGGRRGPPAWVAEPSLPRGRVPTVLDGVFGPAGQELGDLAPAVAVDLRNEPVNRKFFATRAVSARTRSLDTFKFLVPPPCRGRAASRRGPRPRRASSRPF